MNGDVLLSDTNFYKVQRNQPVTLRVTVGFGQPGGTALRLNGASIPFQNPSGPTQIGSPDRDLTGSVLQCLTTVRDENPATHRTAVTYELSGGLQTIEYPYAIQVKADKGNARYLITFVFAA